MDLDAQLLALSRGDVVVSSLELVEELRALGVDFKSGVDGVRLHHKLELLSADQIAAAMDESARRIASRLDIHLSIDSTNRYLMDRTMAPDFHGSICLAETQSAGRGRRGRQWVSPFGRNIYLSLGWQLPVATSGVSGLSLVVGMQIAKSLRALGVPDIGLKWPNDVLRGGAKLAGILIEMGAPVNGVRSLVIGVGVNFGMATGDDGVASIGQPWSALAESESGRQISRNALVAELVSNVFLALQAFQYEGFEPYRESWQEFNLYQDRVVNIHFGDRVIEGVDRGVDSEGNLLLQVGDELQSFNAGEVSLRAVVD